MDQPSPAAEPRRVRVLIPLDADAALRALMSFHHSQQASAEPPPAGERDARA
jgi:hypothetical protein